MLPGVFPNTLFRFRDQRGLGERYDEWVRTGPDTAALEFHSRQLPIRQRESQAGFAGSSRRFSVNLSQTAAAKIAGALVEILAV
jgi:hypothetical protein